MMTKKAANAWTAMRIVRLRRAAIEPSGMASLSHCWCVSAMPLT